MMMMMGPDLDSDDIDDIVRGVAPALLALLAEIHEEHLVHCRQLIDEMKEAADAVRVATEAIRNARLNAI